MREYGSSSEEPEWRFFLRVPVVNWPAGGGALGPAHRRHHNSDRGPLIIIFGNSGQDKKWRLSVSSRDT